jgi:hypothetical protein
VFSFRKPAPRNPLPVQIHTVPSGRFEAAELAPDARRAVEAARQAVELHAARLRDLEARVGRLDLKGDLTAAIGHLDALAASLGSALGEVPPAPRPLLLVGQGAYARAMDAHPRTGQLVDRRG